jgi:CHAT domain-containing protein/tetratricopeptide (TPR) repeat protein
MRAGIILLAFLVIGLLLPARSQVYDDEPQDPIIPPEVYVERLIAAGKYPRAERKASAELAAEIRITGPATLRVAYWYNTLGIISRYQGNYRLALQRFQKSLSIRRTKLGTAHRDTALTLSNTALMMAKLGYYREAEPLYRQALETNRKLLGPLHAHTVSTLSNLGLLNMDLGNVAQAQSMLEDALARTRKTDRKKRSINLATSLSNLAAFYVTTFEFSKAEPLLNEALAIDEVLHGSEHPNIATTLNNLGKLYRATGRYPEAEAALLRALAIDRKFAGPNHPEHAATLVSIAELYAETSRLNLAQEHVATALTIARDTGTVMLEENTQTLAGLARILARQGRDAEAQALLWKAMSIIEKRLGQAHPSVAPLLVQLARTRFTTASNPRTLAFKAHEIVLRTYGLDSAQAARSSLQVAEIFFDTGNTDDALTWAQQARTQISVHFGTSSFDHARVQMLIARAALRKKHFTDAQVAMASAIAGIERFHLPFTRERADAYRLMADILAAREEWHEAFQFARKASHIVAQSARQAFMREQRGQTLKDHVDRSIHENTLRLALEAARQAPDHKAIMAAAFEEADILLTDRMSHALALGVLKTNLLDDKMRGQVERQAERLGEIDRLHRQYVEALTGNAAPPRLEEIRTRITSLRKDMDVADRSLQSSATYQRYIAAPPARLQEIQRALRPGELLVMILPAASGTTVLAATRDETRAHRSTLTQASLATEVTALRQQLDPSLWTSSFSAFSRARAYKLHEQLLEPLKDLTRKTSSLIVMTEGPLASLPFATLVTRPVLESDLADSSPGPLRETAWLIRTHAITSSPSLSSFLAQRTRKLAARSGRWNIVGIGAPRTAPRLQLKPLPQAPAELAALKPLGTTKLLRGVMATERAFKALDLTESDVISFVTHTVPATGTPGQLALALTEPAQADEEDDGLLTGPEIARLRLGPAWVILSACNTAGDGAAATGLLAQSFFQSGASAVLHSHWPVFDRHASVIATGAIANFRKAPKEGQAVALRKAMLQSLADRSHPLKAHPATWAAFSLIGESAPQPVP